MGEKFEELGEGNLCRVELRFSCLDLSHPLLLYLSLALLFSFSCPVRRREVETKKLSSRDEKNSSNSSVSLPAISYQSSISRSDCPWWRGKRD